MLLKSFALLYQRKYFLIKYVSLRDKIDYRLIFMSLILFISHFVLILIFLSFFVKSGIFDYTLIRYTQIYIFGLISARGIKTETYITQCVYVCVRVSSLNRQYIHLLFIYVKYEITQCKKSINLCKVNCQQKTYQNKNILKYFENKLS